MKPAWSQAKARLETEWNGFQADTKKYVDEFAQQAKQQQAIFEEVATAQMKAWRQAADKLLAASAELATDQKTKAEAAVQQMKASAINRRGKPPEAGEGRKQVLDGIECRGIPRGLRPRQPDRLGESQARELGGSASRGASAKQDRLSSALRLIRSSRECGDLADGPQRTGAKQTIPNYAFFFTSLTLEKVMPSARSLV